MPLQMLENQSSSFPAHCGTWEWENFFQGLFFSAATAHHPKWGRWSSVDIDIGARSHINYTFELPLLCQAFRKTVQTRQRHGSKKLLVPKKVSQAISSRFVGLLALFANLFCSATLFVPPAISQPLILLIERCSLAVKQNSLRCAHKKNKNLI